MKDRKDHASHGDDGNAARGTLYQPATPSWY
jgi:hypothetical protein